MKRKHWPTEGGWCAVYFGFVSFVGIVCVSTSRSGVLKRSTDHMSSVSNRFIVQLIAECVELFWMEMSVQANALLFCCCKCIYLQWMKCKSFLYHVKRKRMQQKAYGEKCTRQMSVSVIRAMLWFFFIYFSQLILSHPHRCTKAWTKEKKTLKHIMRIMYKAILFHIFWRF